MDSSKPIISKPIISSLLPPPPRISTDFYSINTNHIQLTEAEQFFLTNRAEQQLPYTDHIQHREQRSNSLRYLLPLDEQELWRQHGQTSSSSTGGRGEAAARARGQGRSSRTGSRERLRRARGQGRRRTRASSWSTGSWRQALATLVGDHGSARAGARGGRAGARGGRARA